MLSNKDVAHKNIENNTHFLTHDTGTQMPPYLIMSFLQALSAYHGTLFCNSVFSQ